MPYASEFLRIRWTFTVAESEEIADTGLNLAVPGGTEFDAAAALAVANDTTLDDLFEAYFDMVGTTGSFLWADYSRLTGVHMSAVNEAGAQLGETKEKAYTASNAGNDANTPPQCTVVGTLWSGQSVGSGNFGRMYLPHTRLLLETGRARSTAAEADAAASLFGTFISTVNGIGASLPSDPEVIINSSKGAGSNKAPSEVRVGRVVDTQRRRRNRLEEDYQSAGIV
jgi:hypothetical protein